MPNLIKKSWTVSSLYVLYITTLHVTRILAMSVLTSCFKSAAGSKEVGVPRIVRYQIGGSPWILKKAKKQFFHKINILNLGILT